MSYEIVHTFGSTIYFVFFLLFLWLSRLPQTRLGTPWWTISIGCALAARLSLFLLIPLNDMPLAIMIYAAFNVLEKPFLLIGMARFLHADVKLPRWWLATCFGELWLLTAWLLHLQPPLRTLGYAAVNSSFMLYLAVLAWRQHQQTPGRLLHALVVANAVLAVHWLAAPIVLSLFPEWFKYGFLVGTTLVLVQYLLLLAMVLAKVHRQLVAAEAKALDLAFHDQLTGLNNRRYMNTLFDHALLLATRPHHVVAVFYIDLDNFKPINDSAGHAVGDEVLKIVAARLKSNTRSTDICARIGGDEFVVIGTQLATEEQAHEVAKKLLATLTASVRVEDVDYNLGASIGVSLYPKHGENLSQLMECADNAMYQVKRNGKSGYEVFATTGAAWQYDKSQGLPA